MIYLEVGYFIGYFCFLFSSFVVSYMFICWCIELYKSHKNGRKFDISGYFGFGGILENQNNAWTIFDTLVGIVIFGSIISFLVVFLWPILVFLWPILVFLIPVLHKMSKKE